MNDLNYRHLRYFWTVAHEGHLTRAAEKLNLSQSALSSQIKTLEARLGHVLFDRAGRRLILTEAGRIALDHADRIFATGGELLDTLRRESEVQAPLRIGALSTLSRNFQIGFLAPILAREDVEIVLKSGNAETLLASLKALALDVVLTTEAPGGTLDPDFVAHRISEQSVALHGSPHRMRHTSLKALLTEEQVILPTESSIQVGFDALCARLDIRPRVVARVDDMAMVRLLARADAGIALAPPVVLVDEIASGRLKTAPFHLDIVEAFFAITIRRAFPHPLLDALWPD